MKEFRQWDKNKWKFYRYNFMFNEGGRTFFIYYDDINKKITDHGGNADYETNKIVLLTTN